MEGEGAGEGGEGEDGGGAVSVGGVFGGFWVRYCLRRLTYGFFLGCEEMWGKRGDGGRRKTHWTVPTRSFKRFTGVHFDLSAFGGMVRLVEERAETAGRKRARAIIRRECDSRALPSG